MFVARNGCGEKICARCGAVNVLLTKDHFIPKSCRMTVNEEGNYVALCRECNQAKANKVVTPDWYLFLKNEQKEKLWRYMRYARSFVEENMEKDEFLKVAERL